MTLLLLGLLLFLGTHSVRIFATTGALPASGRWA